MARAYCTEADVKEFLPTNLVIEGDNPTPNPFNRAPENVLTMDVDFFIQQACADVDSALGTIYDIPLKKVNQGGDVDYPLPVRQITAVLASEKAWGKYLQGADKQRSESQKIREDWAHSELDRIQNGEILLVGQRNTRGGRYVRNTARDVPRNPTEGGRTKRGQ